eukprot:GHVS01009131.1.p1 GENE.GHVS01009131.1~~GHVS01009131.1.p1  ORF type:complete len:182 (-),score=11.48 GHVS01009131.1:460-1005(-)
MMKRFGPDEVSSQNQMKSSFQRSMRAKVLDQFPRLEPIICDLLPKKTQLTAAKCANHITVVLSETKEPLFFQYRDGPWVPTLRIVHKYPSMLPKMQVDRGAIKYVLRGSNIMCPGLTSTGGRMETVGKNVVVQVTAEGKSNACAVGITTMSSDDIRTKNKDICIETYHYLNDGLWHNLLLD